MYDSVREVGLYYTDMQYYRNYRTRCYASLPLSFPWGCLDTVVEVIFKIWNLKLRRRFVQNIMLHHPRRIFYITSHHPTSMLTRDNVSKAFSGSPPVAVSNGRRVVDGGSGHSSPKGRRCLSSVRCSASSWAGAIFIPAPWTRGIYLEQKWLKFKLGAKWKSTNEKFWIWIDKIVPLIYYSIMAQMSACDVWKPIRLPWQS